MSHADDDDEINRKASDWAEIPTKTRLWLEFLRPHQRNRLMEVSRLSQTEYDAVMVWARMSDKERGAILFFAEMPDDERQAGYRVVKTMVRLGWLISLSRMGGMIVAFAVGLALGWEKLSPLILRALGKQ